MKSPRTDRGNLTLAPALIVGFHPDRYDLSGALVCLAGNNTLIMCAPR